MSTEDLISAMGLPRRKERKSGERLPHASITNRWKEFQDNRTVDDSVEGCAARLAIIDDILEGITAEVNGYKKVNRVQTT